MRGRTIALKEAVERLALAGPEHLATLFTHGTLEVMAYAPVGTDPQISHTRDEVYVVARGSGDFCIGGATIPFGPVDFLFVPAGVEHRFEHFTDDFLAWVLFYGPEGGEAPR